MITEKDIKPWIDCIGVPEECKQFLEQLLKERDEVLAELNRARKYIYTGKGDFVLDQLKAAELRASVYREGWIKAEKAFRKSIDKVVPYVQHELVVCEIESEAARIMKEKGGI